MAEKREFNPIEKACADSFRTGWLGDRHFDIEKFIITCQRRGLVKDVWGQKDLSLPLGLFEKESGNLSEEQIDVLLDNLAKAIDFDPNLVKRHFYAIKFNVEDQFLAEELAEEAESEIEAPEGRRGRDVEKKPQRDR